jgi:TRAP-type uncharacterized transport system fused permease subunit
MATVWPRGRALALAVSVAKTNPMATAFESMKIGSIIYFIPFFFVFDPALILIGTPLNIAISTALAVFGIFIFAGALQGYVSFIGSVPGGPAGSLVLRIILGSGAILIALPAEAIEGLSELDLLGLGLVLILPVIGLTALRARREIPQSAA